MGRLRAKLVRVPVSIGYFRGPVWMSRLRKWWVLARNPHADIRFGRHVYLGPGFSLHMPFGGTFVAGDGVEFRRNFRAELGGPETRITVGDRTVFTYDVLIQCATTLDIGADCGIGQGTLIVDGNHRYRDLTRPPLHQGYELRPLTIGDGAVAWSKNTIIANLGERAILASGAIATKPIPAYCVAVGVPARVIDYFGPPGSEPPELANSDRSGPAGSPSADAASSHAARK
jgi:acetyltransferase-like isoleucine patch superfamily enzyme